MSPTQRAVASGWTALALLTPACDGATPSETGSPPHTTATALTAPGASEPASDTDAGEFTEDFRLQDCDFKTVGRNPFFPLIPGRTTIYEGKADGKSARLKIQVLDQTVTIGGVQARVELERQTEDGELVEVARNYFAVCAQNNSVFYFGEDVDLYEHGKIVAHTGSWRHGVDGARAGLIMPGLPLLGSRYAQEVAPKVALDRAEIIDLDAVVKTPYAQFHDVMVTQESTPLEPGVFEFKRYAPGVGLIVDADLQLVTIRGG